MEFTVSKTDLVKELNLSQGVVEKKTTIPILSNVLVEADGDRIYLTATDLEEIVTLRGSLEVLAARLATARWTPADTARVTELMDRNNEGQLTVAEREELAAWVEVSDATRSTEVTTQQ